MVSSRTRPRLSSSARHRKAKPSPLPRSRHRLPRTPSLVSRPVEQRFSPAAARSSRTIISRARAFSCPSCRFSRKVHAQSLRSRGRSRAPPPSRKKADSAVQSRSSSKTMPPAYSPAAQFPDSSHRADTTEPGFTRSRCPSATNSMGWHSSTSPRGVETVTLTNLVRGSSPR